ncbi:MAG: ribonuclease HII [Filifactoraceae bacterium]
MYSKLTVKEIKKNVEKLRKDEYILAINQLRMDNREGVKKISMELCKKLEATKKEEARIEKLVLFDRDFGDVIIAGVDEVGRGPLAGPVVAACVIMKKTSNLLYIDDSKKLSESRKNKLYEKIIDECVAYGIGTASNEEIDKYNILNATFLAMRRAIDNTRSDIDVILVDGNQKIKEIDILQKTIVKGDEKSYSIACASIIAKVYRDRIMKEYHNVYPEYDFDNNKGYGTDNHYIGLKKYGITPIHRLSFIRDII